MFEEICDTASIPECKLLICCSCTLHATGTGTGGLALGTMDFCITLCTYILHRDRDREPLFSALPVPVPIPVPVPVQVPCSVYEPLVPKSQKYQVQLSDILAFIRSGQYETLVKIGN